MTEVSNRLKLAELSSNIAIGHTRWATHGKVNKENAHPQVDCDNAISVVHNGIVENYTDLKKKLISDGHLFKSDTDTEVIPHLIEEEIKAGNTFERACVNAFRALDGAFAALVLCQANENIIAMKKGNAPLVIGLSQNGAFVASDISAFFNYTQRVIYLEDRDLAVIGRDATQFYQINDRSIDKLEKAYQDVDWKHYDSNKGDFEHYMIKEIIEQSDTLKRAVMQEEKQLANAIKLIKKAKSVFLIASGSSYHACLASKYMFAGEAAIPVEVILASELKYYKKFLSNKTAIIAVSQSGETYDVLEAIKIAKEYGSKVVSIVNVPGSSLARDSDICLEMKAGPEISVLSTKTYTAQLALLSLLAYAVSDKKEEMAKNFNVLNETIHRLTSSDYRELLGKLALSLKNSKDLICIGRGLQYATALEAALKIKEVSYIHAEAFAGGELKHGSIALIDNGTPCIVFVSENNEKEILSNAAEVKTRGGYIVGVSSKNSDLFDFWIEVPELGMENAIAQIIPMQILSYQLALIKELDPDKPRHLAKSVTVK